MQPAAIHDCSTIMFAPAASRIGACGLLSETGVVGGRQHEIEWKDWQLLTARAVCAHVWLGIVQPAAMQVWLQAVRSR